jgi:hypothetical protein
VPHQETVAEVLRGRRVGHADRAVEHPERDLPTAVGNVEQESPLAARGIDGPQQIEICGGLHQPLGAPRRQPDVRDGPVRRVCWIEAEAKHPDDLLVRARRTERPAVQDGRAAGDLERPHGHENAPSVRRLSAVL